MRRPLGGPLQVLVVGGEHAFVQGTLAEKFKAIGLTIGEHWDWSVRRPPNKAQGGCEGHNFDVAGYAG